MTLPYLDAVRQGLKRASDMPVRTGELELGASMTAATGFRGWVEGRWRPAEPLSLFAQGFWTPEDYGALAGLRWRF